MGTEETDLPKLAAPARRALIGAGYTRLEHLTKVKESEVGILQRARTPAEVMRILKRQARQAPKDRTGRARAGKEIP